MKSLIKVFLNDPLSFVQQINYDNWKTLKRAVRNESAEQILNNSKLLIDKTKNIDLQKVIGAATRFSSSISFPTSDVTIIASHEASNTGAPLIILEVAKYLKYTKNENIICILCKGGSIKNMFEEHFPTYELASYSNTSILSKEFKVLLSILHEKYNVKSAYINSEGSTKLNKYIKQGTSAKVISLVHELANYYPKNDWNHISAYSDVIIFPSKFVATQASNRNNIKEKKTMILGQGLLKPNLLPENSNRDRSRQNVLSELNLPADAKIVLGCGSKIPRKGYDLFTVTAINTLSFGATENIHFVWLGDSPLNEHIIWADRDVQLSEHSEQIHFIGNRFNSEDYFLASDIFFLTSRGDPFPCVVHEAIAAELPIVMFKNTNGHEENAELFNGHVIPHANITKASNTILEILADDNRTATYKISAKTKTYLDMDVYSDKLYSLMNE